MHSSLYLFLVVSVVFSSPPPRETHPLSAARRSRMKEDFLRRVEKFSGQISMESDIVRLYSRRGDALFFLGRFDEAVADYEKMVTLDATLRTRHWRRGIAWYYAGSFRKAAHQFEIYHTYDDVDRENGIWRYLSHAKAFGREKARAGLLKYKKDDRQPFPAVYRLFAGKITPREIIEQIENAEVDATEREKRRFYARLYIGLNELVEGRRQSAKEHLRHAVANTWAPEAGFGPSYMWHVGRLQYEQL